MTILDYIGKNKRILIVISAVFVYLLMEIPWLTTIRPVMYDEAWYCNTGYNFYIGNGFANTAVGSGGNENFMLPLLVGLAYHLFGVSLFSARIIAVLCGLVTLVFIYKIQKLLKVSNCGIAIVLGLFVSLTICNTIFRFARPECSSLMFCTIGVYFFIKFLKYKKNVSIIVMSVCCSLAILSHPFSILLFALIGVYLLVDAIKNKDYKVLFMLAFLLLSAVIAVLLILNVSSAYAESANMKGVARRSVFSENYKLIPSAIAVYFKQMFLSRHSLALYYSMLVLVLSLFAKNKIVKTVGLITCFFTLLFPIVFPTDLTMVGLGLDYFVVICIILTGVIYDTYSEKVKPKKVLCGVLACYIAVNMLITIGFNYKKYENSNETLNRDIKKIIEKNSLVFGSLRLWFFAQETNYYSDHYRYDMPEVNSFDYLLINSVDWEIYEPYELFTDCLDQYEEVYTLETKQYGVVKVLKNKDE